MHKCARNETLFKWSAVALSIVVALFAIGAPILAATIKNASATYVVVVDAGHGGADAGVIGVRTGVKESALNLKVAMLLGEYLEGGGIRVVYTRTGDVMHPHPDVAGNRKRADMFYRGDVIKKSAPDAVISIHMNFYSAASRRGAQVFFDKHNEQGRQFAEIVQEILNRDVNPELGGREYSALSAEKYLLECSPRPAVIAECGFLSNPLDEAALIDPAFQARLAYSLFQAVVIFLNAARG